MLVNRETRGPEAAEGRMTAATACRTCGTEPREGARFCDGCGAPVTERDAHAEYKQVTVLFADVVHSMDIAAAVGAERLREIMADLLIRAAARRVSPMSFPTAFGFSSWRQSPIRRRCPTRLRRCSASPSNRVRP